MMSAQTITDHTRTAEETLARLFSRKIPFSEHLSKWEDDSLPDKYDHNCFEYSGQPGKEEFQKALTYQRSKGVSFIKLEGNEALDDSFGMDAGVTLTMTLQKKHPTWQLNNHIVFCEPAIDELETLEVKHYGPVYGEDFSRRNIRHLYEKLDYIGAYLDGQLAGACYRFRTEMKQPVTCIDGILVDTDYRRQYIATSMIAHIAETIPDDIIFLHADEDDTPKDMYAKMGFVVTDSLFEYTYTGDLGVFQQRAE